MVQDPQRLQEILRDKFAALYSSSLHPEWDQDWAKVRGAFQQKVTAEQCAVLEQPLEEQEVLEALKTMPHGKCPGIDGFQAKFFVRTWGFSGPLFLAAIRHSWEIGTMGALLNSSMIVLLYKGGDALDPDQWRPISLLTTFYKAIAKALALCVQLLMHMWLEKEQRGFTRGRSISDNLLFFREAK